jgi:hypothetical protein
MVEMGVWKNFDELEDSLILDELLLLNDAMQRKLHMQMRISAMATGTDIGEYGDKQLTPEEESDPLMAELMAQEREWNAKKNEAEDLVDLGWGYSQE